MKITTWNVNGLRAALRKGLEKHLDVIEPDILLLQEIRVWPEQLPEPWAAPPGWHVAWHPAQRKGYAGTAIWSRKPIAIMETGPGMPDPEGRILRARIGKVQVVSAYLPSGSSGEERQAVKEVWMKDFYTWMQGLAALDEPVIVGGDLNVAHTELDIHNASGNKKTSGFLPHEREWFTSLLQQGWEDMFRAHMGEFKGHYSWWSNRGQARALDRGWRIDYLLGNAAAASRLKDAWIRREGGLEVSDHAPVTVDLKIK